MEKVKLPREVAEAIWELSKEMTPYSIIIHSTNLHEFHGPEQLAPYVETLRNYQNKSNLLKAIVNGYEVEQTPEEKAAQVFYTSNLDGQQAIERFADALNIQIQGVNDND